MPSTSDLTSTFFIAVVEQNSELATQIKLLYDMESYGAIEQVVPRSACDRDAVQNLNKTTVFEKGCYFVGVLRCSDEVKQPNIYFSVWVQQNSLEKRLC